MTNPMLLTDFYKVGHPFQYPDGTTLVYSNLTARKSRIPNVDRMVVFGIQYMVQKYLIDYFNDNFFNRDIDDLVDEYSRIMRNTLGSDLSTYDHIVSLHRLGYLPIRIKALPEGSSVNMRVPYMTVVNTHPEFYWVTNFLETLMSSVLWQPSTSATIAKQYRDILDYYAKKTGIHPDFVGWQGHDFSFRGMSSPESAVVSGMGHLLSFTGTDTIPAITSLEQYYFADTDKELVGGSVPATEHSVMCAGEKDNEYDTYKRLITETYPSGIVSIVSDTWDLWKVLTETLPSLKNEIMGRDGKVVIRPDSGNPADILCGNPNGTSTAEKAGVVQLLWDVFGGTITETGYKMLDHHVGTIYGDSITPELCDEICRRLAENGFASQPVFGIGSYTYQYNTRDTFGTAMKATYVEINGEGRDIFKNPVTDDGTKISAKGLLRVNLLKGEYILTDEVTPEEENGGELSVVFENGNAYNLQTLSEIRERVKSQ